METKSNLLRIVAILFVLIAVTLGVITVINLSKKVSADALRASTDYLE